MAGLVRGQLGSNAMGELAPFGGLVAEPPERTRFQQIIDSAGAINAHFETEFNVLAPKA